MIYEFILRARPTGDDPIAMKHQQLIKALDALTGDWKVDVSKFGKLDMAPPCGGGNLSRGMPNGVNARVSYNCQYLLKKQTLVLDTLQSDDYLKLRYNPVKVAVIELYEMITPVLLGVFSAYYLLVTDEDTYIKDPIIDVRHKIHRLGLVNFFDKLLCERAFGISPAAVAKAVKKEVAEARTLHNGVYIILSKDILGPKEIQEQGKLVRNLLPNSPFKK